ncbi:MAG TPA: NADPH:quinone reductase [Tepidisphaeraceae bacterium]|nr:NADPH:quinone reductase [Tepidisphaeraceae bacterium]
MKAIRVPQFGGPEVLKLEEIPDPKPAPNQILVSLRAVGINPVETYIRAGTYPLKPPLPYTPGTDAAGVIESVGGEVDRFKPGDRVWVGNTADVSLGTYAQKTLCNPNQVFPLPGKLSFQQGAAVNVPYITAYHALFQVASAIAGETVLVHGATGGVGLAAVQLASSRGLTVIGTGGTEEGRKLVKDQGASHVLDHTQPDYLDEIMKITNGKGVDVICEMLANKNLAKDLTLLAKRGRVAIIGSRGKIEIDPRDLMKSHGKALGVSPGTESERAESTAAVSAGLFAGFLNPIVDQEYPLAEASKAHEEIMANGSKGKIVLIP